VSASIFWIFTVQHQSWLLNWTQAHNSAMAAEYDHERTLFLQATGIQVIRFENKTVFDHPEWVLEQIRTAVNKS